MRATVTYAVRYPGAHRRIEQYGVSNFSNVEGPLRGAGRLPVELDHDSTTLEAVACFAKA